jgi:exopolyphosphatase/pppGpp-phosphohydrolase
VHTISWCVQRLLVLINWNEKDVQFGLTIQVISAQSEAVFVYNGAMLSAVAPMEPAMCMDMGGGSTEVCCGHSGRPTAVSCISLGSSKLANKMPKLLETGLADREEMMQCMHRIREYLRHADTSAVHAALVRSLVLHWLS